MTLRTPTAGNPMTEKELDGYVEFIETIKGLGMHLEAKRIQNLYRETRMLKEYSEMLRKEVSELAMESMTRIHELCMLEDEVIKLKEASRDKS